jgi:tetratricopeptide (TPR) repeat protein
LGLRFGLAVGLLAGLLLLQAATLSRLVGAYRLRIAEFMEGQPGTEQQLDRALRADRTNGLARWMLSEEKLNKAAEAADLAAQLNAKAKALEARGDKSAALKLQVDLKNLLDRRTRWIDEASTLAERGAKSFLSVDRMKQLASIRLRQNRPGEAEKWLADVVRVKPNDIDALERLGAILLAEKKWDDLERLSDEILRQHPYSANAHFYRAFVTKERSDPTAFQMHLRMAYLMMVQNKGQIFFNRTQLESLARQLGIVRELEEERSGSLP